jgi:hypothetical protein
MRDISVRDHRFKVGSVVNIRARIHNGTPDGVYKVVRLLPADGQDYQYRVKSSRTGSEHVVRESELS